MDLCVCLCNELINIVDQCVFRVCARVRACRFEYAIKVYVVS